MFRTLYSKLVAVLVALFFLVGVFFLLSVLFTTRIYHQEVRQKLNVNLAEHILLENSLMKEGKVDEGALKNIFTMMMVVNPDIELYLLDPEGDILSYSAPPGKVKRRSVSLEPIRKFLGDGSTYPILGDDPRDTLRRKVFSVAPIDKHDKIEGYLYIILGGEQYDSVAQMLQGSYIVKSSILIAGGSLLFALVTGLFLFNQLTKRLRQLTSEMEAFRESKFVEKPKYLNRFDSTGGDEIKRLGVAFTQMADQIHTQIKALKHSDRHRRELVSTVSHDLRTPLASLQGYLETLLLKDRVLTVEEKRDYLSVAIRHCERLGRLISELFELSKLDSPDMKLHREPFSLPELIQDVIQKFHIQAEKRSVSIGTEHSEDIPFVHADIGLIERVIDNLIENALRFSSEGDDITIRLLPDKERVTVQVADTGCGIKNEDIHHIFEPFYRGEWDRREDFDGAGLGLSIAKRILDLHGSDISVESVVDRGTTFSFPLAVHMTDS